MFFKLIFFYPAPQPLSIIQDIDIFEEWRVQASCLLVDYPLIWIGLIAFSWSDSSSMHKLLAVSPLASYSVTENLNLLIILHASYGHCENLEREYLKFLAQELTKGST